MARIALQPASHDERCPFCRDALDATSVRCAGCGAAYHEACVHELGRCGTLGCGRALDGRRAAATRGRAADGDATREHAAPTRGGARQGGALGQGELFLLLLLPFLAAVRTYATFDVPSSFAGLGAAGLSLLASVPLTLLGLGLARLRRRPRAERGPVLREALRFGPPAGAVLSVPLLLAALPRLLREGASAPLGKLALLVGGAFAVGCCLAAAGVLLGSAGGERDADADARAGDVQQARRARQRRWRRRRG